jgi:hypothetical protein
MQFQYKIDELFAEAEEISVYIADGMYKEDSDTMTERMAMTEVDHTIMAMTLKEAADDVYLQIQTLGMSDYPFIYTQKEMITYNITDALPKARRSPLYTAIKDYMIFFMIYKWYTNKRVKDIAAEYWQKLEEKRKNIRSLRLFDKGQLIHRPI